MEYQQQGREYCSLKPQPPVALRPEIGFDRARAILVGRSKWANGTVLHYYFFDRETDGEQVTHDDGTTEFVSWVGADKQRDVVRQAFATWKACGIGIEFVEVTDRAEAEVRIGFMRGDGSWSYTGRDILQIGQNDRTTNYGWSLTTDDYGMTTALHEIGHVLGMPHEHQNPFAGIVWNDEAVYTALAGPPNHWPREKTYHNILRKLDPNTVSGSLYDPKSAMEYEFGPGLILDPPELRDGIFPPGGLSDLDKQYIAIWYPPIDSAGLPELVPFRSAALNLAQQEQADFTLRPPSSRDYTISAFGASDGVLTVFERVGDELRFLAGDDDSGEERSASLTVRLRQERTYVVRFRCYYSRVSGQTALMCW